MIVGRLFLKTLRDYRKGLFWWSAGMIGFVAFALAFYPTIKSQPGINELYSQSKALKAFTGTADITSPAGYLTREIFAITGPIVLLVYGILIGTGSVAGEENRKTLPLLLAQPISRFRVLWDKFAAMNIALLILSAFILASIAAFAPLFQLDGLDYGKVAVGTLMMFLLGLAFGAIGFLVGAATGNRSLAGGVAAALAFGMYLLNTLAAIVDSLEPYKWLSLFYYADGNDALVRYPEWWYVLVLGGVAVASFLLSWALFRRRDIRA